MSDHHVKERGGQRIKFARAETRIAQHLLKLRERVGIAAWRSCQHRQAESGRHWRRDTIAVRDEFEDNSASSRFEGGIHFAQQFLVRWRIKMVKKICDQREVIPVAVFDIKRAAGDGVVTIGDAGSTVQDPRSDVGCRSRPISARRDACPDARSPYPAP